MNKYLICIAAILGLAGCVVTPNIDYSPQKVEKFNPVKKWVGVDVASIKDSPNGNERFKLTGGSEVYVFRYYDNWALLNPNPNGQQWIDTKLLCDFADCYTPVTRYKAPKASLDNRQAVFSKQQNISKSSSNSKRQSSTNTRSTPRSYSKTNSSSCYCTSGTYCVGPRGGHYCLNSTGSKRYLPR